MNLSEWSDYARQLLRTLSAAERAPEVVAWAAGLLMAVQVFEFAHAFRNTGVPGESQPPPPAFQAPTTNVALISNAHLFGAPPAPPVVADETKVVASTGAYKLKGTIAMGSDGEGFAIIVGANGRSDLYQVGHPAANGVVVRKVGPDYALLLNGGRLERLALPRGALAAQLVAAATRSASPAAVDPADALTADTRSTLQTFGLNVVGDSASGITGISGKGSASWQHSGLEPSDVIVSIDGTPVGDVLKTPGALDNASMAAATTLTVLRAGVQMDITAVPEETAEAPIHRRRRT